MIPRLSFCSMDIGLTLFHIMKHSESGMKLVTLLFTVSLLRYMYMFQRYILVDIYIRAIYSSKLC